MATRFLSQQSTTIALALVALGWACAREDRALAPRLPALDADVAAATAGDILGSYVLPAPPENNVPTEFRSTGITVPAGVPVRVHASGKLTFMVNPDYGRCGAGPPAPLPGGLTEVGPAGFDLGNRPYGVFAQLTNVIQFGPLDATAAEVTGVSQGPGTVIVGRPVVIGGACSNVAQGIQYEPAYLVSGGQMITAEQLDTAKITADKLRVTLGHDTVNFAVTLSWTENWFVFGFWEWVPDPGFGFSSRAVEGCGRDRTCKFIVREPGHMRVGVVAEGVVGLTPNGPRITVERETAAVHIRSLRGGFDVRPTGAGSPSDLPLEVSVVDENGAPIPNQQVVLTLDATEQTAGHVHSGGKPPGGLSAFSPLTGPEGKVTVTYTAAVASGPVHMHGSSQGAAPADVMIAVGVPGLEALPASEVYKLVGSRAPHPDSHYGTPAFNAALQTLAGVFEVFSFGLQLEYNDMSLEQGGVFDLSVNWNPPHDEHRVGTNVDLRIRSGNTPFTEAQLEVIRFFWGELSTRKDDSAVNDETTTEQPHYHLRY